MLILGAQILQVMYTNTEGMFLTVTFDLDLRCGIYDAIFQGDMFCTLYIKIITASRLKTFLSLYSDGRIEEFYGKHCL